MTQRDDMLSDLAEDYQSLREEFQTLFHCHIAAKEEEDNWDKIFRKDDIIALHNEKTALLERVRRMEDLINQRSESFRQLVIPASMMRKEEDR